MALYQPTNVTPSMLGALGNGVVDVSNGIYVSWQVDGQNHMTAFQIRILENTSASKVLYDTGKKTDGCPFYGRDEKGNVVFFRYWVTPSALSVAGVTNGNNYKMLITQWWSDTQSVTQQSASVFQCRTTPILRIGDSANPGTFVPQDKTVGEFTATYQQAQGDELAWVRWRLWQYGPSGVADTLLADTGNVPTSVLKFRYDGFFNGEKYLLQCDGETVSGVSVSAFKMLDCSYDVAGFSGTVQTCVDRRKSGVKVSWPTALEMNGMPSGEWYIQNKQLYMLPDSYVSWSTPTSIAESWKPPIGVVWKGKIQALPMKVFSFYVKDAEQSDDVVTVLKPIDIVIDAEKVSALFGSVEIGRAVGSFSANDILTIALTDDKIYVYRTYESGMYPDNALTPEEKLFPQKSWLRKEKYVGDVFPPSDTILRTEVLGPQICDYIWILKNDVPVDVLELLGGVYTPVFDENTLLLADFKNGLQAGTVQTGLNISTWRVYRRDEKDGTFVPACVTSNANYGLSILDCAAVSQHTYTYYVFGVTLDGEIATQALKSDPVTVCLWDWTILECEEDKEHAYLYDGDVLGYVVKDIFRFSLNVESGAVGNNYTPNLLANFTRYPTEQRTPQRYMSGTLSGYLGDVDADGNYRDTLERRDALFALAQSDRALFLKNRKGDLIRITISGQISEKTQDATRQQALICSVPWVETGDVKNIGIFIRKGDALWDM